MNRFILIILFMLLWGCKQPAQRLLSKVPHLPQRNDDDDKIRQYLKRIESHHLTAGLIGDRVFTKSSAYTMIYRDRYDGFRFGDGTYLLGLYLAAQALLYESPLQQKDTITAAIRTTLNTIDRLSRYSARASYVLSKKLMTSNDPRHYQQQAKQRDKAIANMPLSGYIIRSDRGREFHDYELMIGKNRNIEPSQDQYTMLIYGLLLVKKGVADPAIQKHAAAIATRMLSYLTKEDFILRRPFDRQVVGRGGRADPDKGPILMAYPIAVALQQISGRSQLSPKVISRYRNRFIAAVHVISRTLDMRCRPSAITARYIHCNYYTYLMYAFGVVLATSDLGQSSASALFVNTFPQLQIEEHRNALIAALGHFHFSLPTGNKTLQALDEAPTGHLPNHWQAANGWHISLIRWARSPSVYRDQPYPRSYDRYASEFTGLDFVLPALLFRK